MVGCFDGSASSRRRPLFLPVFDTCLCLCVAAALSPPQDYDAFWESFGRYIKLGCIEDAVSWRLELSRLSLAIDRLGI